MEKNKIKFRLKKVISRELESRGMSLSKLAERCEINKGTLHNWCNGSAPDSRTIHHLASLSQFFQMSLMELLFDKEEDGKSFKPIVETTVVGEDGYYRISVKKLD
jgi:transcriptional regulator with XRE-family HTH domain